MKKLGVTQLSLFVQYTVLTIHKLSDLQCALNTVVSWSGVLSNSWQLLLVWFPIIHTTASVHATSIVSV